jgi:hypothetical protein
MEEAILLNHLDALYRYAMTLSRNPTPQPI